MTPPPRHDRRRPPFRGSRLRERRGVGEVLAPPPSFDPPDVPVFAVAACLDRVAKILSRAIGQVAREHGATVGQVLIVDALLRTPGGMTAKELASALAIRPGSLTGMIDTLVARDVLRRERVPGDARQQRLVLMDGAKDLVAALPKMNDEVAALLRDVDPAVLEQLGAAASTAEINIRKLSDLPDTPAIASRS